MPANTPAQEWNAARYGQNARFVSDLGQPIFELLDPQPGERILDLGCGDGALTEKLAATGARVVGVDASPEMVSAANARRLDARVMDAYSLDFHEEFDAVFSNAAMHWMKRDHDTVLHGICRALKPGGRFASEMGGHGCVAAIIVALCATVESYGVEDSARLIPWYFPTPDEYRGRLEGAGFRVQSLALIPRPTPLPTGIDGWLATFAIPFTKSLPLEKRSAYLDEVRERLRPVLCDAQGNWTADYMRLRFLARRGT